MRSLLFIVLPLVVATACRGGPAKVTVTPVPYTAVPAATASVATSTPDTSSTVDAQTAAAQLKAASPTFAAIFKAVASADTAALLDLITWTDQMCGASRVVYCPGVANGASVRTINVGLDTFMVSADGLKPTIQLILAGEPLQLTYAAQLRDRPSVYYVGFELPVAKGKGLAPVSDPDHNLTGLLLTVDTQAPHPIVAIDLGVTDQVHATDIAMQRDRGNQKIIIRDARY